MVTVAGVAELDDGLVAELHRIIVDLVRDGAPLGWLDPPSVAEIATLLGTVVADAGNGDAGLVVARTGDDLAGLGYWRRYTRPTNRPHADLERVAVAGAAQGKGVGRALTTALVDDARAAGIEVLTLDARGDNATALGLYRSLGFTEYGRLPDFVAVGERRYDKVFYMIDLRSARGPLEGQQ
ncbi:GNAT family N-acetyltransferase [Amycolatopsis minnesotensis]|uniref:GNAT family N-acetyltransferase n=1 Tax=Amycolatopsis minnesotensis TaxID=337894 RepID=A0ABP5E4X4_9PSEU